MAKIHRFIPFGFWPSNWGLVGKRRQLAEAEYFYDGEDLERALLPINFAPDSDEFKLAEIKINRTFNKVSEYEYEQGLVSFDPNLDTKSKLIGLAKVENRFGKISSEDLEYRLLELSYDSHEHIEFKRSKLGLDQRYRKLTDEEYDLSLLNLNHPNSDTEEAKKAILQHNLKFAKITDQEYDHGILSLRFTDYESVEFKVAELELEFKHGNITQNEWERETAELLGEPWFNIIGAENRRQGDRTSLAIEMDWNSHFPRFLETQGWSGTSDDEIVDRWFEEAMRQMVAPELSEDQIDAMEDEDYLPPRGSKRNRRDGGITEYS